MELLKILTRDESIAGLEIGDDRLRLVLLKKIKEPISVPTDVARKKHGKAFQIITKVASAAEESLTAGVVVNGELKDEAAFAKAVSVLLKKIKPSVRFAVASLSSSAIYSRVFSFPKSVSEDKLAETMRLAVGFQLPKPIEGLYVDWQPISAEREHAVDLSCIPKNIIDPYLRVFSAVGLRLVAIEPCAASVARSLAAGAGVVVVAYFSSAGLSLLMVEKGSVCFERFVPKSLLSKIDVVEEVRKVVDFYQSEKKVEVKELVLAGCVEEYTGKKGLKWPLPARLGASVIPMVSSVSSPELWLPALGAAQRGILPRSEDKMISLMPVSTAVAFRRQKAYVFTEFLSNLTVGFSLFFAALFVGFWVLVVALQHSVSDQLATLSSLPVPAHSTELEAAATTDNALIADAGNIIKSMPRWSVVLESLRKIVPTSITITGFTAPSSDGSFTLTGVADSRSDLKQFKKTLSQSDLFVVIDLPISNIEQKNNIPFSLTMRLSAPAAVVYH